MPGATPADSYDIETDDADGAIRTVLLREQWNAVQRAIESLPPMYREVVKRHLERECGSEIASDLERPPATVRSQIRRGLALLRSALPRSLTRGAVLAAGTSGATIDAASGAGLAAMRARILEAGAQSAIHTAAGTSLVSVGISGRIAGALTMSTRTVVSVGVMVLLAVAVMLIPRSTDAPEQTRASSDLPPSLLSDREPNATHNDTPSSNLTGPSPRRKVQGDMAEPPQFEWRSPPGDASVRGVVVDAASGRPVRGARVWGYHTGPFRETEPPSYAKTTNADGRFSIEGLDAGSLHTLHVWSNDHAPVCTSLEVTPERITSEKEVDAGIIQLVAGATVSGRVVDARQRAVGDAEIFLKIGNYSSGFLPWSSRPVGRTDEDGKFALDRIPHCDWGEPRLYAISDRGFGHVDFITTIRQARTSGLEIRLGASVGLSYEVFDSDGAPLEGAKIESTPLFPPFTDRDMSLPQHLPTGLRQRVVRGIHVGDDEGPGRYFLATTNAAGKASTPNLPVKSPRAPYCLRASKEGYVAAFEDLAWVRPGTSSVRSFTLRREEKQTISGVVLDTHDRPVSNVEVRRYEWYHGRFSKATSTVQSDADGRFSIDDLVPGKSFHLLVAKEGLAWLPTLVEPAPSDEKQQIVLRAVPADPIRGRVIDQFDNPVEGVAVTSTQDKHRIYPRTIRTGSDGRFELPDTTAGLWRLRIVMPEPVDEWHMALFEREWPAGGEEHRVRVIREAPGQGHLTVHVVKKGSATSIIPRSYFLERVDPERQVGDHLVSPAVRRHEGTLAAEGLKPGDWLLHIECPGYPRHSFPFEVGANNARVEYQAEIGGYGRIEGTVRLDGISDADMAVVLFGEGVATSVDGQPIGKHGGNYHPLDQTLSFRFDKVPPGSRRIKMAELAGEVEVLVKPDETTTCELVAKPKE